MGDHNNRSALNDWQQKLLNLVDSKGGRAGNTALMRDLDLNEDAYWALRDQLVDLGYLELARGKGGSVRIVCNAETDYWEESASQVELAVSVSEDQLYNPLERVLGADWAKDMRYQNHLVEVTARQGRKQTGGTWTRPDVVVAAMRVFPHVPGKYFDLVTFEVKASNAIDVTAVFEALSHRRAATQAYVWLHVTEQQQQDDAIQKRLERILDEAKRQGIGLIVASDPAVYATWDIQHRAARVEPDPEAMNAFIAQQFDTTAHAELAKWFR